MKKESLLWAPAFALLLGASGCTNTVRYLTTMQWLTVPGGAAAPAAPAAPEAPAAAAAPATADGGRTLYVTYWEGTCFSGVFGLGKGCSLGDSKIRRCNLQPDNALLCQDEREATQAFVRKK